MIKSNRAQLKTIRDILSLYKSSNMTAQILAWYTGGGKTHIFLSVIKALIEDNPKVRIGISAYFHTTIRKQIAERIREYGINAETIESRSQDSDASVVIFNPQSMFENEALTARFDYLFIDESHAGLGEGRKMIPYIFKNHCKAKCKVLAISATPWELLSLPLFKKCVIHKRGIDRGYDHDKRVADLTLEFHEADVRFHKEAFNRLGDLKQQDKQVKQSVLRAAAIKKMLELRKLCGPEEKVLVVAPTGWDCGIAEALAEVLGNQAVLLTNKTENEEETLHTFKTDPKVRYLVVVNKCRIGYDMPEITRTINLSMTKNIKKLVHDLGRISRLNPANPSQKKTYHYVFNQAMEQDEVEALFRTVLKCAAGQYPVGAKISPVLMDVAVNGDFGGNDSSVSLKKLLSFIKLITYSTPTSLRVFNPRKMQGTTLAVSVLGAKRLARSYKKKGLPRDAFSDDNNAAYRILLKAGEREFLDSLWPYYTKRTLESALKELKQYKTRKDLTERNNPLYTWMRLHGHMDELDKVLPRVTGWGKWDYKACMKLARTFTTRNQLKKAHPGAYSHLADRYPQELINLYGPVVLPHARWTFDSVVETAQKNNIRSASELKRSFSGAETFLRLNGLLRRFTQVIKAPYREEKKETHTKRINEARKAARTCTSLKEFRAKHKTEYHRLRTHDDGFLSETFNPRPKEKVA